jgi:anti-sigma regulatory factor (Ser/Thr protein kinase)
LDMRIAIEEIVSNVMLHSFTNHHEPSLQFHCTVTSSGMSFTIEDQNDFDIAYDLESLCRNFPAGTSYSSSGMYGG